MKGAGMPCLRIFALFYLMVFLSGYSHYLMAISPPQGFHHGGDFPNESDYISFLQKFPTYGERLWRGNYRGDPQVGYFGSGGHNHNEMRSLSNFIFVYALLAVDKGYDESVSGVSQDVLLAHARAALRYFTDNHVTGSKVCVDGRKWGKQPEEWLSPWVISKAVAGARLIWDELTDIEKSAIRRVVVYQANYQLSISAFSREYRDTYAELNALNAEVLALASSLYPTHPNAKRWLPKAQELFMNTFSVRSDASDATMVDGKPVKQWVYTTNVHPDFTVEGHGAYQFDYIACALHSAAWSYYAFVSSEQPVPQSLFHHIVDVWDALKKTNLHYGRFACLQGKDWARHVYGSYFVVPALVLLQNEFGDVDARLIEQLRFSAFQYEQSRNNNGSIFGERFAYQTTGWPARYETDCYANLGLAYLLHRFAPLIEPESVDTFQKKVEGNFHSKYCDFVYSRSEDVFASFSWRHFSEPYPMALFVPGDDYMVEWALGNLIGRTNARGFDMSETYAIRKESLFEDGFATTGRIREGRRGNDYAIDHYISFTALPKAKLALMIEYLVAREKIIVDEQAGLSYYLPNDIFNNKVRQIYWEDDQLRLSAFWGRAADTVIYSKWINVDDKLGIISVPGNGHFRIMARRGRDVWYGQICEEISYFPPFSGRQYEEGDIIREQCYLLIKGDSTLTKNVAENSIRWLETEDKLIKAAMYISDDLNGLVIANFYRNPMEVTIRFHGGKHIVTTLPPLDTVILRELAVEEVLALQPGSVDAERTSEDTESPENAWDVNGDGVVDRLDISIVANYFGQDVPVECSYNPDVNRDGIIDIVDLALVAIHYGETGLSSF